MIVPTEVESKMSTVFTGLKSGLNKVEMEVVGFTIKAYVVTESHVRIDIIRKPKV